jgi:hypothetical protein
MYRSCSTISSVPRSIDERYSPRKWMKFSKRFVWRSQTGMRWYFSRSVQTEITCISSSSRYPLTALPRLCEPSKALLLERSSSECPRSKSTCGAENSGPMGTISVPLAAIEAKRKSNATLWLRGGRKNMSSYMVSNSNYSEAVRFHLIPRPLGRCEKLFLR